MKHRLFSWIAAVGMLAALLSCTGGDVTLPEARYSITFTEEYMKLGGNSLKLMYPSVSGYSDPETEAAVNEAAAALARTRYEEEGLMYDSEGGYTYTATDAVVTLAAEDFYSVYIIGVIASDVSGGTDTFAYTMNCDLRSGAFLDTEAIAADYSALSELFLTDDFTADFGGDALDGVFSRESLISQYKASYGIYPCLYFREGRLGILVDTLPSLEQGCAGFSADIRDVRQYLHTENPSIAALCGLE